jgi:hypothetical protein
MTRPGKINRLPKNLRASLRPIGNNGSSLLTFLRYRRKFGQDHLMSTWVAGSELIPIWAYQLYFMYLIFAAYKSLNCCPSLNIVAPGSAGIWAVVWGKRIVFNWWLVYGERKIAVNKWNKRPQSKKDDETWQDKQITEKFKGKSASHWFISLLTFLRYRWKFSQDHLMSPWVAGSELIPVWAYQLYFMYLIFAAYKSLNCCPSLNIVAPGRAGIWAVVWGKRDPFLSWDVEYRKGSGPLILPVPAIWVSLCTLTWYPPTLLANQYITY